MLYFAEASASRCGWRHSGNRQPQSRRSQWLQDGISGPPVLRRRHPARSAGMAADGAWQRRPRRRSSERDVLDAYIDRLLQALAGSTMRARQRCASAGTPATAPPGPRSRRWPRACRASIICFTPRSTATSPTIIRIPPRRRTCRSEALVADKNLDFGVAFDGDGDRIGVVDGEGRMIWGDQLLMIYAEDCAARRARARRSSPMSRPARRCSTASPSWAASR